CQPIKFSPSPYPAPLQRNRQPFFRRSHSALAPELHDKRLKRRFVHVGFWAAHVAAARPYRSSWASVILRRCARRDSRSSLKLIALRFAIGTLFRAEETEKRDYFASSQQQSSTVLSAISK